MSPQPECCQEAPLRRGQGLSHLERPLPLFLQPPGGESNLRPRRMAGVMGEGRADTEESAGSHAQTQTHTAGQPYPPLLPAVRPVPDRPWPRHRSRLRCRTRSVAGCAPRDGGGLTWPRPLGCRRSSQPALCALELHWAWRGCMQGIKPSCHISTLPFLHRRCKRLVLQPTLPQPSLGPRRRGPRSFCCSTRRPSGGKRRNCDGWRTTTGTLSLREP